MQLGIQRSLPQIDETLKKVIPKDGTALPEPWNQSKFIRWFGTEFESELERRPSPTMGDAPNLNPFAEVPENGNDSQPLQAKREEDIAERAEDWLQMCERLAKCGSQHKGRQSVF